MPYIYVKPHICKHDFDNDNNLYSAIIPRTIFVALQNGPKHFPPLYFRRNAISQRLRNAAPVHVCGLAVFSCLCFGCANLG
jgi:hypothetical protein